MALPKGLRDRRQSHFGEAAAGTHCARIMDSVEANVIKFDADDSAPDYIGIHETATAAGSDANWTVFNFTYSGDNITQITKAIGDWDGRSGLF